MIKIRKISGGEISGLTAEAYPACDYCGDEINKEHPGNIEYENENGAVAYLLHKGCSREFRLLTPLRVWAEIEGVSIRAK